MSDITWIQAFQLLLQMFRTLLTDDLDIADDAFDALVDAFMDALPALLKSNYKRRKYETLTTELLPGIEFSRCISKIYVQSLSFV